MTTDTAPADNCGNFPQLADDLVTEEMCEQFWAHYAKGGTYCDALRAVAPMIAARAQLSSRIEPAVLTLIAAEREAIAQLVEGFGNDPQVASAIRARGETT
jgi:hypothetical protein